MCQLVSNGAFLKTTELKNRPIKISLRFAVWSQFYQQALIKREIELFWFFLGFFPSYKRLPILNVTNQVWFKQWENYYICYTDNQEK